jgi:hypothetical protein
MTQVFVFLAQNAVFLFSRSGSGNIGFVNYIFGHFVRGEFAQAVAPYEFRVKELRGTTNARDHRFAQQFIFGTHAGNVLDAGEFADDLLDLARADAIRTDLEEVALSSHHVDESILVAAGHVSGVQPTAAQSLIGILVQIALHNVRPARDNLPDFIAGYFIALLIHDPQLDSGDGDTD